MKNDQEPNAYRKANQNAAPDMPVSSLLGLIALSHRTTLLPALQQSKGQMPQAGLLPAAPFLTSTVFRGCQDARCVFGPA